MQPTAHPKTALELEKEEVNERKESTLEQAKKLDGTGHEHKPNTCGTHTERRDCVMNEQVSADVAGRWLVSSGDVHVHASMFACNQPSPPSTLPLPLPAPIQTQATTETNTSQKHDKTHPNAQSSSSSSPQSSLSSTWGSSNAADAGSLPTFGTVVIVDPKTESTYRIFVLFLHF